MNLDLREIPAVYINLEQDVERKNSIVDVLDCLLYTSDAADE